MLDAWWVRPVDPLNGSMSATLRALGGRSNID